MDERRESPRLTTSLLVRFESFDDFLVEYTENISKGGMFVRTVDPAVALGAVVRVAIELPDRREVTLLGRVARVVDADAAAAEKVAPGVAVEFLDLGERARAALEAYLNRATADEQSGPFVAVDEVDMTPAKLLLIDDSATVRTGIAEALTARGFTVRTAEQGLQGLSAALSDPPDIVVSDVEMPGMDGWTLLRMLRARKALAKIPIVFLTRLSGEPERMRGYQLGVDDFISKETSPDEIATRLRRLLHRVRGESPRTAAARSLRGDLRQVSVASLLTFMDLERKTGVLSLADGSRAASVYLRHGRPVRATVGKPDMDAFSRIFEVLAWTRGDFEFTAQEVPPDVDDLQANTVEILMEYARRTDEAQRK